MNDIIKNGLWQNNPALVQLLGLCPLLAVSNSAVNALGLGLATIVVLVGSNLCVSIFRHQITPAVRLPVFVMIIATFTTCTEMLMQAFAYPLYQALGIFIPLIVTNCTILGRAEAFASKNKPGVAMLDGLSMGIGFSAVLLLLGSLRELFGTGQLFANMNFLFPFIGDWSLTVFDTEQQFLLAILPPGAFIFMGFIIAFKNLLDKRAFGLKEKGLEEKQNHIDANNKRARIT